MNLTDNVPFTSRRDPLHDWNTEEAFQQDEDQQFRTANRVPYSPPIQSTPDVWTF